MVEPPPGDGEHLSEYVIRLGTRAPAPDVAGDLGERGGPQPLEASGPVSSSGRHALSNVEGPCPLMAGRALDPSGAGALTGLARERRPGERARQYRRC